MFYEETFKACSAQALCEERAQRRLREAQRRQEYVEDTAKAALQSTAPLVEELKSVVKELQDRNLILQKQIDDAEETARTAQKDALWAKIGAIVSFIVSTTISVIALFQ